MSSAAGPQARVDGPLPSGGGPKGRSNPNSRLYDANGTGIEVGDLSTAPVSPDIDYVQGQITATVNKIKSEARHYHTFILEENSCSCSPRMRFFPPFQPESGCGPAH